MANTDWYDTRVGRIFYWGVLGATLLGVAVSTVAAEIRIPAAVYLFGFLGATVYAFTSFAKGFGDDERYRLKILSRTVAVFPLAAGVYLLAFAFPGVSGELSALAQGDPDVTSADRIVAGLAFLTGVYVSATLKALGGLAERLLGLPPSREGRGVGESEADHAGPEGGDPDGDGSEGDGNRRSEATGTDIRSRAR